MFDRAYAKRLAKQQLQGEFLLLCFVSFAPALIAAALSILAPGVGSLAAYFVTPILSMGVCLVYINRATEREYRVMQLFAFYPLWWKGFCSFFLISVKVFLWSLLFVIPGIIEGLRCSMTYYILAENPDLSASEAIALSKEVTAGHLWDLIGLELSFFGWLCLLGITSGLASLWVLPYHTAVYTNAYLMFKQDYWDRHGAQFGSGY